MGDDGDDLELLARAREGDRDALDRLLRRHHDRVWAVCRRMAGNDADAADACQEALISVVRGLPGFDGRSSFSTWVYRVATNACLDELRRRRRRPEPGLPPEGLGPVASDHGDGAVTRIDLDSALASLPAEFRAAVVLRDVCDLSYDEIGRILDVPPGTVRSRIARGRAALAPLMAGSGDGNPGSARRRPSPRT